jgi:hypothetical protein
MRTDTKTHGPLVTHIAVWFAMLSSVYRHDPRTSGRVVFESANKLGRRRDNLSWKS